jgi:hypothetical protein
MEAVFNGASAARRGGVYKIRAHAAECNRFLARNG